MSALTCQVTYSWPALDQYNFFWLAHNKPVHFSAVLIKKYSKNKIRIDQLKISLNSTEYQGLNLHIFIGIHCKSKSRQYITSKLIKY